MRWEYNMYTVELTEQELNELFQYSADQGEQTEQVKELKCFKEFTCEETDRV